MKNRPNPYLQDPAFLEFKAFVEGANQEKRERTNAMIDDLKKMQASLQCILKSMERSLDSINKKAVA